MLDDLDTISWDDLPQAVWNGPGEVPKAPLTLAAIANQRNAHGAYNRFHCALGNNHAGTYCPVALWAIPFLGPLLATGTSIVRETVLDILIDLTGSFVVKSGFENARGPSGSELPLDVGVRQIVASLRSEIQACHASEPIDSRARNLAAELIQLLDELPPD
jgi:hypothetical protein